MIYGRKKNFCNGKKKTGKGVKHLGIRKNRLFKIITIFSTIFTMIGGAVLSGTAPFCYEVYALPPTLLKAKTMAELIFTLAAGAGTGLSGPVAVPGIMNAYGGPSYSIESMIENDIINLEGEPDATTQEIIDAIGHQNRLFNIDVQGYRDLMSNDWQVMVDSGMDVALRFNDLWETNGQYDAIDNLGAILKDVLEIGYVQGEMTIVNLANPETAATVAISNIASALRGEYHDSIIASTANVWFEDRNATMMNNFNASKGKYGAWIGYKRNSNNHAVYSAFFDPLHVVAGGYRMQGNLFLINLYNLTDANDTFSYANSYFRDENINANTYKTVGTWEDNGDTYSIFGVVKIFETENELNAYINNIKTGVIDKPVPYTPNLINQDDGFITETSLNPSPLINNDGMDLVDANDYMDMVDNVSEDPDNAVEIYNNFLDPYLMEEAPEIPEEPLPTYAPVRPVEPEQPTLPDKDEVTSEDQETALKYATPGLEEVFPFCIPFDIWKMLKTLTANREAPVFEFPLVIESQGINEVVTVDLSVFDTVATILRVLELILFVIGLAVATRRLIGA